MAILSFPSIIPESQSFGINFNTQISVSDISGITQTVELPGARWRGTMGFSDMTPAESAELKAFMLELRGSAGSFYYGDITNTTPFLPVIGSPTIQGVSTVRIVRVILNPSSPAFSTGDYIQIGDDDTRELKMVLLSTNVTGDTYDLIIEPLIRRTDFIGLPVVYTNPTGRFFLANDTQAAWTTRSKALLSDMNLDFIEIF